MLEHIIMKARIKNIITFCCMVVVLGTQALLEGSWKVEPHKSNNLES
ncbi:hypothetical protein LX92_00440 [Maribacter polysiphoniae]|uniref:Uncharacterized protein n=1 Tax=Maribacter polysiphoniae TaxID=429344 RepID=A0A316E4V1_9FLAO|nr:hypothetical protein LX92_00440 [Maribacter polysiphoniae]